MIQKLTVRIPENLNFSEILEVYPFTNFTMRDDPSDYLSLLCATLVNQQLKKEAIYEKNGKDVREEDYTNLTASYLRPIHNKYNLLINYLIKAGVLETDNHFKIGKKSRGYRFSQAYRGKIYREIPMRGKQIKNCIQNLNKALVAYHQENTKEYDFLIKWYFNKGLEIDSVSAKAWVNRYCTEQKSNLNLTCTTADKFAKEIEKIELQRMVMMDFIEMIESKNYDITEFSKCSYGRLHGFFTYRKSELRNFITYKGEQLVSIDIKNSQPYFSSILLNKAFWLPKSSDNNLIQLQDVSPDIYSLLSSAGGLQGIITLLNSNKVNNEKENENYQNLVITGKIYEFMFDELHKTLSKSFKKSWSNRISSRNAVKIEMLRIMYSISSLHFKEYYEPCRIFNNLFPLVGKIFNSVKEEDYTLLPKLLQRLESHLVLKDICKHIDNTNPEVPIFTIHDCIVTTEKNVEFVKNVINEILAKRIGVAPSLKIEPWDQANLKAKDDSKVSIERNIAVPNNSMEYSWSNMNGRSKQPIEFIQSISN